MTTNNLFITGGQFVAAVIDGILSPYKKLGWRYSVSRDFPQVACHPCGITPDRINGGFIKLAK